MDAQPTKAPEAMGLWRISTPARPRRIGAVEPSFADRTALGRRRRLRPRRRPV